MFFIFLSYYVFDEYSLVLVLNRMSKKLKSVMKKLFRGKSRVGMADTLFQGCSTASSRRAEMMKYMNSSLVGPMICSQRDEVIFLF
jgi:FixJ family two-component response regulator